MGLYKELFENFLAQNKLIVIAFIIITLLTFPVESIVIPELYGRLLYAGTEKGSGPMKKIGILIAIIIGVWLVIQGFYVLKNYLLGKILPKYLEFTTKLMFKKTIENYEDNYKDINIGKNISRLFELAKDLKDLFYYSFNFLLPLILTVIIVNSYFFFIDWKIGLSSTLSLIVFFGISILFAKKIIDISTEREARYIKMNEVVQDKFDNLMNIYLNNEKSNAIDGTFKVQEDHTDFYTKQLNVVNAMQVTVSVVSVFIFSLIIGIAFWNLKTGKFTVPRFITLSLIIIYFLGFLINISNWTPEELMKLGILKYSKPFLQEILAKKSKDYVNAPDLKGDIELKKMYYSYNGTSYLFKDFNFQIKKGDKVAILGPSGSGKTTLMKLILGLHKPSKGEILINGVPVNKINPEDLRKEVNYINQRTGLNNGTVLENMKYGNNVTTLTIIGILNKYGLMANFKRLKKGINSDVGQQGRSLSGGMQKIIMNIRGILKSGDIVIFDEPLAGLDAETRTKMIELVKEMCKNKTLIIITHDKEILSIVDKTINLHKLQNLES